MVNKIDDLYHMNQQESDERKKLQKRCQDLELAVHRCQREDMIQQRLEESNTKLEDELARLRCRLEEGERDKGRLIQELDSLRRNSNPGMEADNIIRRAEYTYIEGQNSATPAGPTVPQHIVSRGSHTNDGYYTIHCQSRGPTTGQRQATGNRGRDVGADNEGGGARSSAQGQPTDLSQNLRRHTADRFFGGFDPVLKPRDV